MSSGIASKGFLGNTKGLQKHTGLPGALRKEGLIRLSGGTMCVYKYAVLVNWVMFIRAHCSKMFCNEKQSAGPPEWRSGLRHCIAVLAVPLEILV